MIISLVCALVVGTQADPIVDSFAFFGCNRVDKDDWDPATNPSSANVPQLQRSFADIAAIRPRPSMLFMVGDLVLGYSDDDGTAVRKQLDAWIGEYRRSPLSGKVTLIPVAGNHELNRKVGKEKLPSSHTTAIWNDWLHRNKLMPLKPNGPRMGGADLVTDDQSRLNFSFDRGKLHFTIVNTDCRATNGKVAWIPSHWARQDVEAADRRGQTVFVLGHRNLLDPLTSTGDSPIDPGAAAPLIDLLNHEGHAVGYLCAHVHAWDVRQFEDGYTWQVIAGNGGSPLEDDWKPAAGRTFGFALVQVHKSGQIELTQYARPADASPDPKPAVPVAHTILRASTPQ